MKAAQESEGTGGGAGVAQRPFQGLLGTMWATDTASEYRGYPYIAPQVGLFCSVVGPFCHMNRPLLTLARYTARAPVSNRRNPAQDKIQLHTCAGRPSRTQRPRAACRRLLRQLLPRVLGREQVLRVACDGFQVRAQAPTLPSHAGSGHSAGREGCAVVEQARGYWGLAR